MSLRRNPAFALTGILTLALGIGASTMIFSVADGVLLHPFPYRDAGSLVTFRIQQANYSGPPDYSVPEFLDFRSDMRGFQDLIGYAGTRLLYRSREGSQQVPGAWVTTNTFSVLEVEPQMGRVILPEDEVPGAQPACIISDQFWREQFNADPNVLGTTLEFNGELRIVAGIMPPRFRFLDAAVWLPYSLQSSKDLRLEPLARLKPGVSLEAATAEFDTIARRIGGTYPEYDPKVVFTTSVRTLLDDAVGSFKNVLYTVGAAVAMLLLIACGNVGNLLLARATVREREMAIRAAVGATRGRLIRHLLTESWILAAAGGAAGVLLAYYGLSALQTFFPPQAIPGESVIEINRTVLLFALGLTFVTTLLCGLAPALRAVQGETCLRLIPGSQGAGRSARSGKLRGALVIAEVSLSMVLLVGAGLMTRTYFAITHVELGFNPANLLQAQLVIPEGQRSLRSEELLESIRRVPGVTGASLTMETPGLYGGPALDLDVPGKTHSGRWSALLEACDETYFQTMGRTVKRGRLFTGADAGGQSAVVNETFARAYFDGEDPVGRRFRLDASRLRDPMPDPNFTIIGVVSDARNHSLRERIMPQAYLFRAGVNLIVRTAPSPLSLVESIRRRIWAVDPNVVMTQTGTVEQSIDESAYAEPRFGLVLIGAFSGVGFLLASMGVFSLMAYSVSVQTHEIGVRAALGARQSQILGMVFRRGLRLTGTGIVIGLLASLGITRLIASQLWGVSATDPWTLGVVTAILIASGLAACYLPALRAARVDPMVALRE